ncbi:MAG TPA: hypothetical protein DD381_12470 [Lentisphaeria bacterium]|nr:MAG: hypothetical protein A2X47_02350 [Lentisphaerae bacterium GWF2_38_69]HBM17138.1 hypothetical protein [Lentisphaeria bacterium]
MDLLSQIYSDETLDFAYRLLCRKREKFSCNNDIWDLRANWGNEKERIKRHITSGAYTFDVVRKFQKDGENIESWSARDSIVLTALYIALRGFFRGTISKSCANFKGHGGLKGAVREVALKITSYKYVIKTDIRSYYASINHEILMEMLGVYIKDKVLLSLIYKFLKRTTYFEGYYIANNEHRGISRSNPLSVLLGSLYLKSIDEYFSAKTGAWYCRYMDDIIIFTKNRFQIDRYVRKLYNLIENLKLKLAKDKTFIGRLERGFEFLGYKFTRAGLEIAKKTIDNFKANISKRLYEPKQHSIKTQEVVSQYVARWKSWVLGGLGNIGKEKLITQMETTSCLTLLFPNPIPLKTKI